MRKILVIIVSVLMLAIMGTFVITFYYNFSVGNRVGKVMKFSKKGYVIKTWEGQLFLGGIGGGDGEGGDMNSTYWNFSVYPGDDKVRKEIQDAMDKGHRVKLEYEQKLFTFTWRGDTEYFVVDVEKIEE